MVRINIFTILSFISLIKLPITISSKISRNNMNTKPTLRGMEHLIWTDLNVHSAELRPDYTLNMGQCFNWIAFASNSNSNSNSYLDVNMKQENESPVWIGVLKDCAYAIRQTESSTEYALLTQNGVKTEEDHSAYLKDYFQLKYSLGDLYSIWARNCERMKVVTECLPGVRVVRQEPFECLISFICSSNNNIKRITLMLNRIKAKYGSFIGCLSFDPTQNKYTFSTDKSIIDIKDADVDTDENFAMNNIVLYSFPTPQQLSIATEQELRDLGCGYRAKFIAQTSQLVVKNQQSCSSISGGSSSSSSSTWLDSLRQMSDPKKVQQELITCQGVGPKVADCVALFSLDQHDAIPVDTHVWDICVRDYEPSLMQAKSLTPAVYDKVGDSFRHRFPKAGWAHSVLFAAELPYFKQKLPAEVIKDMDAFDLKMRQERKLKKVKKDHEKKTNIDKDTGINSKKKKTKKRNEIETDTLVKTDEETTLTLPNGDGKPAMKGDEQGHSLESHTKKKKKATK